MTHQELKAIRRRLKLTTAELGERLGVSGRTVEDWEQGRRKIRGPAEVLIRQLQSSHDYSSQASKITFQVKEVI